MVTRRSSRSRRTPRTSAKLQYEFDGAGRLVVRDPADLLRPVQVLEGQVTADRQNRLVYRVTQPRAAGRSARRITLRGSWGLSPAHELMFRIQERSVGSGEPLELDGGLIEADAQHAVFTLAADASEPAQQISLAGRWQVDERNRLTFLAAHADGSQDRLTFHGSWELGPRHELRYRVDRPTPRRTQHPDRVVTWLGRWDFSRRHRLVYRLAGAADRTLELSARLERPILRAADGRLAYQVGIAGRRGERSTRLVFFGRWQLLSNASVTFELPVRDGRREAVEFGGTVRLSARREFAVRLSDRRGQPLGLTVVFTQRVAQDAALFVRLRRQGEELEALGGIRVQF